MARIVLGAGPDPATSAPLARRLRDAGHEVVLTSGTHLPGLVATALQEDAGLVLLDATASAGSTAEMEAALAAAGAADVAAYVADPADVPAALARAAAYDGDG